MEKEEQGFVSLETPEKLLREISEQEGITVARVNGRVVGYLMPLSIEQGKQAPLLDPFIERFETVVSAALLACLLSKLYWNHRIPHRTMMQTVKEYR